jgi:hypothetical protein
MSRLREAREKITARFSGTAPKLTPAATILEVECLRPENTDHFSLLRTHVGQWIENRIKDGTLDGLRAAIQVDPANARLAAYFGRALADFALAEETDPDASRRARG